MTKLTSSSLNSSSYSSINKKRKSSIHDNAAEGDGIDKYFANLMENKLKQQKIDLLKAETAAKLADTAAQELQLKREMFEYQKQQRSNAVASIDDIEFI